MGKEAEKKDKRHASGSFEPFHVDILVFAIMLLMAGAMLAYRPADLRAAAAPRNRTADAPMPTSPPTPVPAVEPVKLVDMSPDQARAYNAAIPFSGENVQAARALVYEGGPADHENALTCLATAAWYEAGDDRIGEQAVAQVVLNRARHPAFPKTVCGVVFEGSDRKTGCQFTFACDGSLARIPSPEQWRRAREIAEQSLSGFVYKPVGTATHYHTDWVVPYWSSSLTKLTEVHTHIFYRWAGWWGLPQAFSAKLASPEIVDPRIAALAQQVPSPEQSDGPGMTTMPDARVSDARSVVKIDGVADGELKGNVVQLADLERGFFVLLLDPNAYPGSYAVTAVAICRSRVLCQVAGWLPSKPMPDAIPVDEQKLKTAVFKYRKEGGDDSALWDCGVFARTIASQCLPGTGSDRSENHARKDR